MISCASFHQKKGDLYDFSDNKWYSLVAESDCLLIFHALFAINNINCVIYLFDLYYQTALLKMQWPSQYILPTAKQSLHCSKRFYHVIFPLRSCQCGSFTTNQDIPCTFSPGYSIAVMNNEVLYYCFLSIILELAYASWSLYVFWILLSFSTVGMLLTTQLTVRI